MIILIIALASFFGLSSKHTSTPPIHADIELGALALSGANENETYNIRLLGSYDFPGSSFIIAGHFLKGDAEGTETARNWSALFRYERNLDIDWRLYLGYGSEGDPYFGYTQRDNADLGVKYTWIFDPTFTSSLEAGYRYSKINRTAADLSYENFGRLFFKIRKEFKKEWDLAYWFEYLPSFSRGNSYLINTEPSVSFFFNEKMALKVSCLIQYQDPSYLQDKYIEYTTGITLLGRF